MAVKTKMCLKGRLAVKSQANGAVVIEGFANKAVVDRADELIEAEAWPSALDNFMKNPQMLFNHGLDPVVGTMPVGKFVEVDPRKDGLFVRGKMSQIKAGPIADIRQLVEERMLSAFSVGFNPIEVDGPDADGVKHIKSLELAEISVVGIPMNQDSLFGVVGKDGKAMAFKSYYQIAQAICQDRGSAFAAAAHSKINDLINGGGIRSDILEELAWKCGVGIETIYELLAGNFKEIPIQFTKGFETALGFEFTAFDQKQMDDEEDDKDKDKDEKNKDEEEEGDDKEEEKKGEDPGDKEADPDDEDKDKDKGGGAEDKKAAKEVRSGDGSGGERHTHNVRIDDESGNGKTLDTQGDGPEHSHGVAEGKFAASGEDNHTHPDIALGGGGTDSDEEDGKNDADASENEKPDEKNSAVDETKNEFQQCVAEKIQALIKGGMDPDQAIAEAINKCREEGKCAKDYTPSADDYVKFFNAAEGGDSSVQTKQAEQGDEPVGGNAAPTEAEDLTSNSFDQAKQTNVMLGSLVSEMQGMRDDFKSLVEALTTRVADDNDTSNEPETEVTIPDDDEEESTDDSKEFESEEDESDDDDKDQDDDESKSLYATRMKRIDDYLLKVEASLASNGF